MSFTLEQDELRMLLIPTDNFGRKCEAMTQRMEDLACCCMKGSADSIDDAEFPCSSCPVHPHSLMSQAGFGCRRHGYQQR